METNVMSIIDQRAYRAAFIEYLRKGTPIRFSTKETRTTQRYIWQTQRDTKVRPSHRANDGRIFLWTDGPATGHPGEDYNCRCNAIPYVSGETEFAYHEISPTQASSQDRWENTDFVWHYYRGGGKGVTLSEIGHLQEIAEQYAYSVGVEGAFRRLTDQIADEARKVGSGSLSYGFYRSYDFGAVEFSHGGGVVTGQFEGQVTKRGQMIIITGMSIFRFTDSFEDPISLGFELGGTPYEISGEWSATFSAEVFQKTSLSQYGKSHAAE